MTSPKFKIAFALAVAFAFCSTGLAENTQILKCRVSNQEWLADFVLDAVGAGFAKIRRADEKKAHTCSLKVEHFVDGQSAVSPEISVEFSRGSCDAELGSLESEILKKVTLIVDLTPKDKPTGRVQWLRTKQPDKCVVEKIRMFDISLNAKKWLQGNWGRNAASDPAGPQPKK